MITRRGIGGASLQDARFVSFSVPETPRPEQTVGGISTNMLVCCGVLVLRTEASTAQVRQPVRKPKNDGTRSTQDRPRSIIYQFADLPRVTSLLDWIGLKRLTCRPLPPCSQPLCKHRHIPTWPHEVHHASMNASSRPFHGFENMARPRAATADCVNRQRPC